MLDRCGVPVRIFDASRNERGNNQLATFFIVSTENGLAPPDWQNGVGEVLLFRSDGLPVTRSHVALLWNWFSELMDRYGQGNDFEAEAREIRDTAMTREALTGALAHAIAEQRLNNVNERGEVEFGYGVGAF